MDLLARLAAGPIVGDGAMGTMLQARGLESGMPPDLLNLEEPGAVGEIHAAYVEAGAEYLETNTFGANRLKLGVHGLADRLSEIIMRGVEVARRAAGSTCMVAGSVGPTGKLLEPYGDTPHASVREAYGEVATLMERAGIDFFLIETMTDLEEARIAVRAAREASAKPVVATSVFAKGAKGYRTIMGKSPEETALALVDVGATFVGTNCSSGMDDAVEIMKTMTAASRAAIVAQPNAGIPRMEGGALVYPETPFAMASGVPRLVALGVRMLGGCCGTTPDHIKAMASALERL
ncbi:MAG TPA: homocysteine S-methyltransferase family protein [bacterium]|nr:homocysteine S-methyltransferase family protein [bacterium]